MGPTGHRLRVGGLLTFGLRSLIFRLWLGPMDHDPMGQGPMDHGQDLRSWAFSLSYSYDQGLAKLRSPFPNKIKGFDH